MKITTKFFLITFVLSIISAAIVSAFVNGLIRDLVLNRAKTSVAEMVQIQANQYINQNEGFSTLQANDFKTDELFNSILKDIKTDDVLRIKVWNSNGDIIFSEAKEIVGQNFSTNEEFQEAIAGEVVAEIKEPNQPDNIAEQGYRQLMEVYVPIRISSQTAPTGVIEVYYKMDAINNLITKSQITIIGIIGGVNALFFIFLSLFFEFFIKRPIVNVVSIANEISRGNMNVGIETVKKDEIGQLLLAIDKMRNSLKIVLEEYEKKVSTNKNE